MSNFNPLTFELLLLIAQDLPLPLNDDERAVHWCGERNVIGISRQQSGSIELFLCGAELRPHSPLIKRHLMFDQWTRFGGEIFRANRLVFPSDEHFNAVAAFLVEELLRRDVINSLAFSFSQTEPLIELMLTKITLSQEELLGLLGELRFLETLLAVSNTSLDRSLVLDAWRGHERGTRDFVFGNQSVEVKSTRGDRSRHPVSGVMQVDPRRSDLGEPQEQLFLLSFGFKSNIEINENSQGLSLPNQVEKILQKLSSSPDNNIRNNLQELFLAKVSAYGNVHGLGYCHDEMHHWAAYSGQWQHGFTRIYDMNDESIQVVRRRDIQGKGHVVLESVSFSVDLPDRVTGELNPQNDLFLLAHKLLG